jgi:hypothetical protein
MPDDSISILLKEYDTLKSEILQRCGHRFALLGMMGAVLGYGVFKSRELTYHQFGALAVAALFLTFVWIRFGQLIVKCSNRIAEIETMVNKRMGEDLLVWETRCKAYPLHIAHRQKENSIVLKPKEQSSGTGKHTKKR